MKELLDDLHTQSLQERPRGWGDVHIGYTTDCLIPWSLALVVFLIPNSSCFNFSVFIVFEAILEGVKLVWETVLPKCKRRN